MKEAKAMAYVNMYGVLATLENLCEIDEEAKEVIYSLKNLFLFVLMLPAVLAAHLILRNQAVK